MLLFCCVLGLLFFSRLFFLTFLASQLLFPSFLDRAAFVGLPLGRSRDFCLPASRSSHNVHSYVLRMLFVSAHLHPATAWCSLRFAPWRLPSCGLTSPLNLMRLGSVRVPPFLLPVADQSRDFYFPRTTVGVPLLSPHRAEGVRVRAPSLAHVGSRLRLIRRPRVEKSPHSADLTSCRSNRAFSSSLLQPCAARHCSSSVFVGLLPQFLCKPF